MKIGARATILFLEIKCNGGYFCDFLIYSILSSLNFDLDQYFQNQKKQLNLKLLASKSPVKILFFKKSH